MSGRMKLMLARNLCICLGKSMPIWEIIRKTRKIWWVVVRKFHIYVHTKGDYHHTCLISTHFRISIACHMTVQESTLNTRFVVVLNKSKHNVAKYASTFFFIGSRPILTCTCDRWRSLIRIVARPKYHVRICYDKSNTSAHIATMLRQKNSACSIFN